MKQFDKGSAVFKHRPEDFIVEEITSEGSLCEKSDNIDELKNSKVDFGKLDVNDRRAFLMCNLEKVNLDHFNTLSIICKELGKGQHEIGFAGNKDKLAWTCQRISLYNPNIERLSKFSYEGIRLKDFRWGKHKIRIGDLKGNRFSITLRDVDKDAVKILNRVRNTEHIPNFFGVQRFGSVRKDNFNIGRLIIQKMYKEAVFAYLIGYGQKESKEVKLAKKRLKEEKSLVKAKDYFPKELHSEIRMLEYLYANKEDWTGALGLIGENTLLIMCQSVQSRLFNEVLEKAIDHNAIDTDESLQILGYNSKLSDGKLGRIEQETLKENDICIADFMNEEFPFLTLFSTKRKAFFSAKDMNIEIEDDEIFKPAKKIKLQFTLGHGSYATSFLEYFFDLR